MPSARCIARSASVNIGRTPTTARPSGCVSAACDQLFERALRRIARSHDGAHFVDGGRELAAGIVERDVPVERRMNGELELILKLARRCVVGYSLGLHVTLSRFTTCARWQAS